MGDPFVLYLLRTRQPPAGGSRNRPPPCRGSNGTRQPRCHGLFGRTLIPAVTRGVTTLTPNSLQPHCLRLHSHIQMCVRDSQIKPDANSTTGLGRAGNGRLPASPKECVMLVSAHPKRSLGPASLKPSSGLTPTPNSVLPRWPGWGRTQAAALKALLRRSPPCSTPLLLGRRVGKLRDSLTK